LGNNVEEVRNIYILIGEYKWYA